jgi:hypothetical protein
MVRYRVTRRWMRRSQARGFAMSSDTFLKDYKGHKIYLNDRHVFYAVRPDGEQTTTQTTMVATIAMIDNYEASITRSKRVKIRLPVRGTNGAPYTITGVHGKTGYLNGVPDGVYDVYPDVPWIVAELAQLDELRKQASAIVKKLRPYEITTRRGFASIGSERFEQNVQKLVDEHAEKTEAAETSG